MNTGNVPMKSEERISLLLRALYEQYGYAQYKMSKFEEYDLYVSNKDFLISDSVITFTDTNGKLMALKPDMTLSIVKNTKDAAGTLSKVYYDENVYRVSKGTHSFKEIKQVGLECIGDLDAYSLYEVLMLAAESLQSISGECVLDISHLGILSGVLESLGVSEDVQNDLLRCMGEKNPHELTAICKANAIQDEDIDLLKALISLYGTPKEVLPKLAALLQGKIDEALLKNFTEILEAFQGSPLQSMLRIDFSVVSDMHYYNGIVFKGFVKGIPDSVLSGGQYDKLLQKMNRKSGAIGFAVYLDLLERMEESSKDFDVDILLLYTEGTTLSNLRDAVARLSARGDRVMVQRAVPEKLRARQVMKLTNGEVELLEDNA
ncbi:MAG: ATP phosphoribosyltransferase regulatory subunit [Clostridia bacterium]|nr:ATP phosphoribosyltransferase regulatory subunit [Clostridia bacterium]